MTTAPASAPATGPAPLYRMRGVNLFASGKYRGKPWPAKLLRLIAANARRLGPSGQKLLVPPAVLGHEEDQDALGELLDRSDNPAAGWVDPDSVRTVPDPNHPGELILTGDVVNIPAAVKAELDAGTYRYGSAEIYDDFLNDFGKSHGKALRRFALLGGEVPQVKRLGPLPKCEPMPAPQTFSERPGVRIRETRVRRGGITHTYAETTVMDRQSMLAALTAAMPGVAQATLDALTDDQLADLVKNLPAPAAPAAPAAAAAPAAPSGMFADMPREELVAALADMGQDQAELEAMEDDELQALYDELSAADEEDAPTEEMMGGGTEYMGDPASMSREEISAELVAQGQDPAQLDAMSDDDLRALYAQLTGAPTAAAPAAPVAPMSERRRPTKAEKARQTRGTTMLSEQRRGVQLARRLNSAIEGELSRMRTWNAQQKRADAESFCDRLVTEGRATPAQVKATIYPLLLTLDNTRAIHRYSENGRTTAVSAYELKKRELAKLPVAVKLGERFSFGEKPTGEAEEAKMREIASTLTETALRAAGYKGAEDFVQKFSEARKKKPTLTAKEYCGA